MGEHLVGCVQYFHQARMDHRRPATTGADTEDASQHSIRGRKKGDESQRRLRTERTVIDRLEKVS